MVYLLNDPEVTCLLRNLTVGVLGGTLEGNGMTTMKDALYTARYLIEHHDTTLERLWIGYWGNGGEASMLDFESYVYEARTIPAFERQVLEWAIEETHLAN